jgi:queuosine precursor transporter
MCLHFGKVYIFVMIAILSVLMNIMVNKPYELFGLTTYGGNALYACIFFAADLLTEYYGKKEALKAVRVGFLSLFLFWITSLVYTHLQVDLNAEGAENIENAVQTLFSPAFGIVVASVSAFLISSTRDIYIYSFLKSKTGERFLWLRNNVSTLFSQFIDTVIFSIIAALFGIFDWSVLWEVILFAYIFKAIISVLETPFLYISKYIAQRDLPNLIPTKFPFPKAFFRFFSFHR